MDRDSLERMYHQVVVLLILLIVGLVATLANLYDKVEALERRIERFEGVPRANDEAVSTDRASW